MGVADPTAIVYSVLVVAILARTGARRGAGGQPLMPRRFAGPVAVLIAVGVLLGAAPAVLAGHDRTGHEHPAGHHPVEDGHHDDEHDHG